ncbi:MAG: YfcC family protein [Alphaproteobacteria bacterium]|nr:YfcC family protein [Alphaproteobacteria bacterium]
MATTSKTNIDKNKSDKKKFLFPSAYSILFGLIIIMAIFTWIIPGGEYQTELNEALEREVPIAGTYQEIEANSQGFFDVIMAPIAGFYDPVSYIANATDVAVFVLMIGGFIAVVSSTRSMRAGINATLRALKGREKWMIPILMLLFALGGTTYGMAEETLAFYIIIIPVLIAAGYDSLTGVAIIMVGAAIGVLGSTINPFATVIASDASGIAFTEGIILRAIILAAGFIVCAAYVMRYAARVKADPTKSLVYSQKTANEKHFLQSEDQNHDDELTTIRKIILSIFGLTFVVMIWGVSSGGWWMAEMSTLFLTSSILIGIVARMNETEFCEHFINGARDLLGVAMIITLARGIVVIMDAGNLTPTLLHGAELALADVSNVLFINLMFWIEMALSFLVPSTSGLAVLTMPIMAPLSDFAGVGRELAVTAYQSASGIVNFITPTSAVVMGGLALGRVSYDVWLKFIMPLLAILFLVITIALSLAVLGG